MGKNSLQKNGTVFAAAAVCCLLWGSAFPCVKIGYSLFGIGSGDSFSQILFAGIRFFTAGIITLAFSGIFLKKPVLPRRSSLKWVLTLSFFQTVLQYTCFYLGLARTTGTKGSVITSLNVFLTIIISAVFFRFEKLTLRKMVGCLLGFAGVIVINSDGLSDISFSFSGEGLVFLSAVFYGISSALTKKYSRSCDPVLLCGQQFVIGGLVMIITGLCFGGRIKSFTPGGGAMLLYLSVLSAAAFSLWSLLLKHNAVSKVSVFGFMNPVFGVILSVIFLSESVSPLKAAVSLILITSGILIVNMTLQKRKNVV